MISEPELVGGVDFPAPRPAAETLTTEPPSPRPPRPSRPWLWALGGAVVASAVWAGGLYAYEQRGPDLGGYRASRDVCADAELKALSADLGKKSTDTPPEATEHRALDTAFCTVTLGAPETGYTLYVSYTLHKVTDPGPEFEARMEGIGYAGKKERVPGLGEVAFFGLEDDNLGAWLRVMDGQAELELSLSPAVSYEDGSEPVRKTPGGELAETKELLVEDMKALMAALKK